MAIFANISNDAALMDGPVQASDVNLNGLFVTPNGFTRASSTGGPPVTFSQGAPIDANGCVCVQPNGSVATWSNGLPLDNHGRICISNDPVAFVSNGLPFALNSLLRAASMAFSPHSLFASGEPGAWYDPADFSTLFQDAAGTTPVTALGQPVGRVLDKSGRGNHLVQTTTTSRPTINQDSSGFFLQFDGVDDWLQSAATVDMSTTDKVMVVAGLRKLSDAATGVLVELSASADSNAGGFYLANLSSGAWQPQTGPVGARTFTPYFLGSAPRTSVLATVLDNAAIGAGEISLRENGQVRTGTAMVEGGGASGNFLAHPIFIGSRGGTTFPYNGRLNGLIIRGTASTPEQIANAERWMAQRTGVTL